MSHFIDVKFRVDGMNVLRDDCDFKMDYGQEIYSTDDGYSVLVDVDSGDMVNVLKGKGYEVKRITEVSV